MKTRIHLLKLGYVLCVVFCITLLHKIYQDEVKVLVKYSAIKEKFRKMHLMDRIVKSS